MHGQFSNSNKLKEGLEDRSDKNIENLLLHL